MAAFSGTVSPGTPVVITMPRSKTDRHIQVNTPTSNPGRLTVSTRVTDGASFVTQTTLTAETKIIDMIDVEFLELTAQGADMDYNVTSYRRD